MSLNFEIKSTGKKLTKNNINNILGLDVVIGYHDSDSIFVHDIYEGMQDFLIYDPKGIGRGVSLSLKNDGRTVEIYLNQPAASVDVDLAFSLLKKIAQYFETDVFIFEGESTHLADVQEVFLRVKRANTNSISSMTAVFKLKGPGDIYGALNPISLEVEYIDTLDDAATDEQRQELFDDYLLKKQTGDYYFARLQLFRHKEKAELIGLYTLGEGQLIVFPSNPYSRVNDKNTKVDEWLVGLFDKEDQVIGYFEYFQVLRYLREIGVRQYDRDNVFVMLTQDNIQSILTRLKKVF